VHAARPDRRQRSRVIFWLSGVALLVFIQALMVAGEFALMTVDRNLIERMAEEGNRRAKGILKSLKSVSFQLSGAQFGITWTTLASGAILEPALGRPIAGLLESAPFIAEASRFQVAIALGFVLSTAIQMVIGELIPKNLAIAKPRFSAFAFVPPLRWHNAALRPLIHFLNESASVIMRWFGMHPREELTGVRSLEELELMVRSLSKSNSDAGQSFALLSRALALPYRTAGEVIVPRLEVEAIAKDASIDDLVKLSLKTGRSRFPVYEVSLDDAVHLVQIKDVYRVDAEARSRTSVAEIMTKAYIVPESRDVQSILVEMGEEQTHLALVADEYGGTAGILTVEDIVEEITGEIFDEHDTVQSTVATPAPNGAQVMDGSAHRDEVAGGTGVELPEGHFETLAGFLLERLGHIPLAGEQVHYAGWTFEVTSMDQRRIAQVKVTPPGKARIS